MVERSSEINAVEAGVGRAEEAIPSSRAADSRVSMST